METLQCLIAGLRPACLSAANRIAIALLLIGAGLGVVQPCAAISFQFEETGSDQRNFTFGVLIWVIAICQRIARESGGNADERSKEHELGRLHAFHYGSY